MQRIADIIGTKSESQLRTFYMSNRRRYNLDQALKKYETDKEASGGGGGDDDIIAKLTAEVMRAVAATEATRTLHLPKTSTATSTATAAAAAAGGGVAEAKATLDAAVGNSNAEEKITGVTVGEGGGLSYGVAANFTSNTSVLNTNVMHKGGNAVAAGIATVTTNLHGNAAGVASGSKSSLGHVTMVDSGHMRSQESKKAGSLLPAGLIGTTAVSTTATAINAINSIKVKESSLNVLNKMRQMVMDPAGTVSVTSEEDSSLEFHPIDTVKVRSQDYGDEMAPMSIRNRKMMAKHANMKENNVCKATIATHNIEMHDEVLEADEEEDDEDDDVMEVSHGVNTTELYGSIYSN